MITECPTCGTEISPNARACPECRSSLGDRGRRPATASAGAPKWEQHESLDGVDLPLSDEDFDYDEFLEEEFGTRNPNTPHRINGIAWYYWVAGVLLLVCFALVGLVSGLWW